MKNEKVIIALILLLCTISQFAMDVYLPSLPAMKVALNTTPEYMQLSLTFYLISFAIAGLFYGPISDAYGRRAALYIGLSLLLVSSFSAIFVNSTESLLFWRFVQGAGAGSCAGLATAIARDSFSGVKMAKVISYMSIAWSVIPITAPALGGIIQQHIGWRANFFAMFIYVAISVVLIYFYLPETNNERHRTLKPKKIIKDYIMLLTHGQFISMAMMCTISFSLMIAFVTTGPFLFQDHLYFSPSQYGILVLLVASSYTIGSSVNSYLINHFKPVALLFIGATVCMGTALIMIALAYIGLLNMWSIAIPVFIIILASALLYPNASALSIEPFSDKAGSAAAMCASVQLLGCSVSSAFMAFLPNTSQLPLALVLFGLSLLALIILILFKFFGRLHQ